MLEIFEAQSLQRRFLGMADATFHLSLSMSVAAKKCTILAGRKRRWSGYGLAT
jgi:hypothetical protein